jgi:hypothetical protein
MPPSKVRPIQRAAASTLPARSVAQGSDRRLSVLGDRAQTDGFNPGAFDPRSFFHKSLQGTITSDDLKKMSQTILFDRAIERIGNGVASMQWTIKPPDEDKESDAAHEKAKQLTAALKQPNQDIHDTYTKLVKSLVRDLLTFGTGTVERQPGMDNKSQPFWLWPVDCTAIKLDPQWDASREGIDPRFWYAPKGSKQKDWVPIYNKNMFLIQSRSSTQEIVPPSPIRLAYDDMNHWLGLHGYQTKTVNQAVRDYMIALEDADANEVDAFREYWRTQVVGMGEIPVIGGKVSVVKFGAKNDEELYLGYTEYLTGLLALQFGLSHRDFGLQKEDSYATADVAQSHSFQDAILPIAQAIIEHLNNKVINFYAEGFSITLSDDQPTKEVDEANRANTLYKTAGLATRNEGRQMVGLPPLPGEDKFADGGAEAQEGEQDPKAAPVEDEEAKDAEQNGNGNGSKNGKKPPKMNPSAGNQLAAKGKKVMIQASTREDPIQLSLF